MVNDGRDPAIVPGSRTASGAPGQVLWTVQWMRAAAALMVVIGHAQSAVANDPLLAHGYARWTVLPWGAGVDLFFVISGFIMVHASRGLFAAPGGAATFVRRRLERIVPLYWLVTTLFLLLLAAASLKGADRFPGAGAILASYAFVPFDSWGDGAAFPVFDLGWTLNYEVAFYALFAGVLAWPRARAVGALATLLVALVAIGGVVPEGATALRFWTRPIILDFGLGVGVGLLAAQGVRLPAWARLMLVAAGSAALAFDPTHLFNGPLGTTVANGWPRVVFAGVPTALTLAGAVLGPQPRLHRWLDAVTRLGDASYSLYLLHPFALIAMEKLVQKSAVARAVDARWLVVATVALAVALALLGRRYLERPIARRQSRMRAATRVSSVRALSFRGADR